jgi:hypothetical protein
MVKISKQNLKKYFQVDNLIYGGGYGSLDHVEIINS